jgi:hypothetical protein
LDHNAIQHLTGDITDNMFGNKGSPLTDFKPTPRTKKKQALVEKAKQGASKKKDVF